MDESRWVFLFKAWTAGFQDRCSMAPLSRLMSSYSPTFDPIPDSECGKPANRFFFSAVTGCLHSVCHWCASGRGMDRRPDPSAPWDGILRWEEISRESFIVRKVLDS